MTKVTVSCQLNTNHHFLDYTLHEIKCKPVYEHDEFQRLLTEFIIASNVRHCKYFVEGWRLSSSNCSRVGKVVMFPVAL